MFLRAVVLLAVLLPAVSRGASNEGPLRHVMDATVFIEIRDGERAFWGSGFLVCRQGTSSYVVTNNHVIAWGVSRKLPISVTVFSGTNREKTYRATAVGQDGQNDLALLRIDAAALPAPIVPARMVNLQETMPVVVLGYPFGELLATSKGHPAVTVVPATVSSIRLDDTGKIRVVQIHGELNPGNSGGPVVDQMGNVVGVAVAKVENTQIGFAIPAAAIEDLFLGCPGEVQLTPTESGPDWVKFNVHVTLSDPLNSIAATSILVVPDDEGPDKGKDKGKTTVRKPKTPGGTAGKIEQKLTMGKGEATGELTVKKSKGDGVLVQAKCIRKSRQVAYGATQKVALDSRQTVEVLELPKSDAEDSAQRKNSGEWLAGKSADSKVLATKKQTIGDLGLTSLDFGADSVQGAVWSVDGKYLFLLQRLSSRSGSLVSKIAVPEFQVVAGKRFDAELNSIQMTAMGLLAAAKEGEYWLLDSENCRAVKRLRIPGGHEVLTSPALRSVFRFEPSGVTIVDLGSVTTTQVKPQDIPMPKGADPKQRPFGSLRANESLITSDGRYLLNSEMRLSRFRITAKGLECEEVGRKMTNMGSRIEPVVGDPRHVIIGISRSDHTGDELEPGLYLFDVESLGSEPVRLPGHYGLVVEGKTGRRYWNNHNELWIYSGSGVPERRYQLPSSSSQIMLHPSSAGGLMLNGSQSVWLDFAVAKDGGAEPAVPKPSPGENRAQAKLETVDGVTWHEFKLKGGDIGNPSAILSRRGDAVFVLETDKRLRKYRLPEFQEEARLELGQKCEGLANSSVGVLLKMGELQQLWILNEKDLSVVRRVPWCGGLKLVAAANQSVVLGTSEQLFGGLVVCDLAHPENARVVQPPRPALEGTSEASARVLRAQFNNPQLSPDGKSLLCQGSQSLFRFGIAGTELKLEEAIEVPYSEPMEASFSSDSKYVAMGKAVCRLNSLKNPIVEFKDDLRGGIAFDAVAGRMYSMTMDRLRVLGRDGGVEKEVKIPPHDSLSRLLGLGDSGILVFSGGWNRSLAAVDLGWTTPAGKGTSPR